MPATPRRHSPSSNGNDTRSARLACTRPAKRIFAMRTTTISRLACAAAIGFALCGGVAVAAEPDPWPELAQQMFKGRPLADGVGLIAIDMPGRAEDAAIVPVTVRATLPPGDPRRVNAFTIVIDENPAPLAATS